MAAPKGNANANEELRNDIKALFKEIGNTKADLTKEIGNTKAEITEKIADMKAEVSKLQGQVKVLTLISGTMLVSAMS
ncbi:hypothetical protein Dda_7658 [Drechslerella dactyloides]|uniref:Uncharacterized protein n=1 Tax=Drechslerella dactyloides TaxID=74499 RepID=A0AAD6ITS3_DREDA|nr:hypothetical protein Dda_7658 [Drechslerella dactyloides]